MAIVFRCCRGTNSPLAKITNKDVYKIRAEYDSGKRGKKHAHRFKISEHRYNVIGRREAWVHLPEKTKKKKGVKREST